MFHYLRPTNETWTDRTLPPPKESIQETIIDCSDLSNVYEFADEIPKHAGHHYCSTAVEWKVREHSTSSLLHCDQYLKVHFIIALVFIYIYADPTMVVAN